MTRLVFWRLTAVGALSIAAMSPAIPATAEDIPSVAGTVTDRATGAPIAGACITAFLAADQSERASTCTGSDGTYQLPPLPTDSYKVQVQASGYADLWAFRAPDFLNAQELFVRADDTVQFDAAMWLGSGSISGHITDEHGQAALGTIGVERADDQFWSAFTQTDGNGDYRMDNIPPGPYRVSLSDNVHGIQWAHGQESPDTAEIFTITDGGVLTVDEQFLPLATVVVTVLDSRSHRPVRNACVDVITQSQASACGPGGALTITGVQSGTADIFASDPDGTHFEGQINGVEITRSGPNTATLNLDPAASIVTTFRDAATHEPVSACVEFLPSTERGLTGSADSCNDPATGRLVLGPLLPITTKLFVQPNDEAHGAMWVAAKGGGTGDERDAMTIRATVVGAPTTIPPINVGPSGSISGLVLDRSTGAPVSRVCAHPFAFSPKLGDNTGAPNCTRSAGRYVISGLGTYDWPVQFVTAPAFDVAWQWSGDQPDRFSAEYVHVTAGQTASLDAHVIRGGGAIDVQVNNQDGTPALSATAFVYNADTGDFATWIYDNTGSETTGQIHIKGLVSQQVKIEYQVIQGVGASDCWFNNRPSFESATRIPIQEDVPNPPVTAVDCGR